MKNFVEFWKREWKKKNYSVFFDSYDKRVDDLKTLFYDSKFFSVIYVYNDCFYVLIGFKKKE